MRQAGIRKTSVIAVEVSKRAWLASKPGPVDSPGMNLEGALWVPNRSSTSGDLGIFVDQSAEPIVASEAKVGW